MNIRKYIFFVFTLCTLCNGPVSAQKWTTHFAYNNVTQIALSPTDVYAISDGNLFSVNKISEQITKYDRQSGLHSTGISCIYYDEEGKQLIIAYANGKIDILSESRTRYLSELYNKDMTQRKDIYNVSIYGRTAYLSTHFGVQTLDLRENKLVDSYWLRPNGEETPIKDVEIHGDSIYAFLYGTKDTNKKDSVFSASLNDNLSDYTVWSRAAGGTADPNKGKIYVEDNVTWSAGGSKGIVCQTTLNEEVSTTTYKPDGPLQNIPYSMTTYGKELWVVPGGRWGVQNQRPGVVMHYTGSKWNNIETATIQAKTGNPTLDFMDVAVDPRNTNHYFVTSYGTGLYEFDHDTLVRQYLPGDDNTLVSAASNAKKYTRVSYATYDQDNNLWMFTSEKSPQLHCIDASGEWHGMTIRKDDLPLFMPTPSGFCIDARNPNLKWFSVGRQNTCLCLLDDNGTRFDESDDILTFRKEWIDQNGEVFNINNIFFVKQDSHNRIWFGTENGIAYIPEDINYTTSNKVVVLDILDKNGENPFAGQDIQVFFEDKHHHIWIGTHTTGIYVLSENANEIIANFTIDNSALPSNYIMSIACDIEGTMYIGTDEGIVSYDNQTLPTVDTNWNTVDENLDMGQMQQWRLHYSYRSPSDIAITPNRVFAHNADGALFSLDLKTEELEYWTKSNGLNGSIVRHIAYDEQTKQLIIGYDDGRIDLLADDGSIRQMPDITLKASSIPVTINAIDVGSQYVYLSMPFGIVAINARKAEVAATYYIGNESSAVDVLQVIEKGDSLYAFTSDLVYKASLNDDLVNFAYWKKSYLPTGKLQQAVKHRDQLYILQHDSLYRWEQNKWTLVRPEVIKWIHSTNNQLLVYCSEKNLLELTDKDLLAPITKNYTINDACFANGVYWLAVSSGLIRVNANGNDYFQPSGPNCNFGYRMIAAHDRIYIAAGGRWAIQYVRNGYINIYDVNDEYDGKPWRSIDAGNIGAAIHKYATDLSSIAVDPNDAGHFFAASYGRGIFEFKDYQAVQHYSTYNSYLREAKPGVNAELYTFTDGVMIDNSGYLWVLNATSIGQPLHILTPKGQWHAISLTSNNTNISFTTPYGIWVDKRNEHRKWMFDQRYTQGVILLDDGGTPTRSSDDKCIKRDKFVDQNGNILQPATYHSWVQDYSNRIWIGTDKGIIIIPSSVDFFTSNACRRIIIPRNDGTGLGDYLLGEEQINCMAVDGGNRMWIGTQNSGLYLIEDDTITVAHFTERNSLLPSNTIQSIAIMPTTGEVFVGTEKGIASYRSDASEAKEDLKQAYAFPNPVRPDYGGMISIAGLMDNTVVNIIDASGNLVCKTRSHGGLAVWDGKLSDGRRATPGVYTALCNAEGAHTVVKILVIR